MALLFICGNIPSLVSQTQYLEDGLRYAIPSNMYSVRQGAFGVAYSGLADDYAATFVNPAGLTLLPTAEFSAGMQYLVNNNTSRFLNNAFVRNQGTFAPTHIGLVLPVRTGESGNFSFSLGFSREGDFTRRDTLSGFNTESTLISSWVDGQNSRDLRNNFAWRMKLADTVNGRFVTPLRNNLQQNISLQESGEMNTLAAGFGIDLTKNLAVGVSLIGSFGTYRYFRRIQEVDIQNRYNRLDARNFTNVDFFRMAYAELLTQRISGVKIIVGAQGRINDNIRVGASVTLPTQYQILEDFSQSGITRFDPAMDSIAFNPTDPGTMRYFVTSPFVVNVGASAHFSGLTLTFGGEYTNFQEMNFRSNQIDANTINLTVRQVLSSQFRFGAGAEYEFAGTDFVARGSFNYITAPYISGQADVSSLLTGAVGLGYYLAVNSRLDVLYRVTQQSMTNMVYQGLNFRSEQNIHTIALQYSVRF
jgi:long-subunit fatty acid transport protein